ncbi:Uncharacterised protein [Candidatus Burarchaeum australiense]|nr:Uncharacterised protein [Candidatus Burarchaeum australiense]
MRHARPLLETGTLAAEGPVQRMHFRRVYALDELDTSTRTDIEYIVDKKNRAMTDTLHFVLTRGPLIGAGIIAAWFYTQENREQILEAVASLPIAASMVLFGVFLRETNDTREGLKEKVNSGKFFKDAELHVDFPAQTHVYYSPAEKFEMTTSVTGIPFSEIRTKPALVLSSGNWPSEIGRELMAPVSWAHKGNRTRDLPFLLKKKMDTALNRHMEGRKARRAAAIEAKIEKIENDDPVSPNSEKKRKRALQRLRQASLGDEERERLRREKSRLGNELWRCKREQEQILFPSQYGRPPCAVDGKKVCELGREMDRLTQELEKVEAELKGIKKKDEAGPETPVKEEPLQEPAQVR